MRHWLRTLGSHGVEPHDTPAAVRAWQHMHWPLFGALLVCVPAFYLELIGPALALTVARCLYAAAGLTGMAVFGWMLALTRHPSKFLRRNALDAALMIAALLSVLGGAVPWSVPEWVLRLSFMGALALRIVLALRALFVPQRLLILLAIGAALLLLAGAGFYLLEPHVHTYAEGLWLAFESSATVGYGDIVPTTPASRVFAVFIILLGYGMLSLTFASIAALFIGEEEQQLRRDIHRDIKRLEAEVTGIRDDLRVLHELLARSAHASEDPNAAEARRQLR